MRLDGLEPDDPSPVDSRGGELQGLQEGPRGAFAAGEGRRGCQKEKDPGNLQDYF